MVTAAVLFQAGWLLRSTADGVPDPVTGNRRGGGRVEIPGRGLLQAPNHSGFTETTATAVKDERMVLWAPTGADVDVTAGDELVAPTGEVWHCISDGLPRSIPGHAPDYIAVKVRRAKEKT